MPPRPATPTAPAPPAATPASRDVLDVSGAARGSPSLPAEVGLHPPGARTAPTRSRSGSELLRQVHGELQRRVVPRRPARSAGVAAGPAGVRFPPRRPAGAHHRARSASRRRRRALGRRRHPRPAAGRCRAPSSISSMGSLLDDGTPERQRRRRRLPPRAGEDPDLVAALINLANIRYARDELAEAQALYERAILLDPALLRGALQPREHPPRSRPLRRRRRALPRSAGAQHRVRRRPLLSRGHAREDGPFVRCAPALARLPGLAPTASGSNWPASSATTRRADRQKGAAPLSATSAMVRDARYAAWARASPCSRRAGFERPGPHAGRPRATPRVARDGDGAWTRTLLAIRRPPASRRRPRRHRRASCRAAGSGRPRATRRPAAAIATCCRWRARPGSTPSRGAATASTTRRSARPSRAPSVPNHRAGSEQRRRDRSRPVSAAGRRRTRGPDRPIRRRGPGTGRRASAGAPRASGPSSRA